MTWPVGQTFDYNDIRKHGNCVERGHDLRRVGTSNYFNCKCGASAKLIDNNRLEIDHGRPKSKEEQAAERAARKAKHERSRS